MADGYTFEFERKKTIDYLLPIVKSAGFLAAKPEDNAPEIENVALTTSVALKGGKNKERDFNPENLDLVVIFKGPVADFIKKVIKPQIDAQSMNLDEVIFTSNDHPNRLGIRNAYLKSAIGNTMAEAVEAALTAEEFEKFAKKLAAEDAGSKKDVKEPAKKDEPKKAAEPAKKDEPKKAAEPPKKEESKKAGEPPKKDESKKAGETPKKDESKKTAEQAKADQAKAEQAKAEQAKAEQAKADQAKAEQAKAEQAKAEQAKAEQAKADQAKADQAKADQAKAEQAKAEQAKAEQAKAEQAKAEQAKADKLKAEQAKKNEPPKPEESKKPAEEPKQRALPKNLQNDITKRNPGPVNKPESENDYEGDHKKGQTPPSKDPNKTDEKSKKQSASCLSFLFCKPATGKKEEAAAGQTETETVDPLKAKKDAVCKALEQYISMFKFSVFGHHHNGRAIALRDAVKRASSLEDITGLLVQQATIIAASDVKYLPLIKNVKFTQDASKLSALYGNDDLVKSSEKEGARGRYTSNDGLRNKQLASTIEAEKGKKPEDKVIQSWEHAEKASGFLRAVFNGLREVDAVAKPQQPEAAKDNTHSHV